MGRAGARGGSGSRAAADGSGAARGATPEDRKEVGMTEDNRAERRPRRLLSRAMEWFDRAYWARDDDIAHRMNWQVQRGRRGRRKYRDLRFDVLLIVRGTRPRTIPPRLDPGGVGGLPSNGPFNLG